MLEQDWSIARIYQVKQNLSLYVASIFQKFSFILVFTKVKRGKTGITHEKMSSSAVLNAGLIGLLLRPVQRCSMGEGAGIASFCINSFSCSMYSRSFMLGLARVPAGKQVSDTHCWPPQSKPRISSLHPTLYPSDFFQNSASAWFTFPTWTSLRGSRAISLSLNSVNESSLMSGSLLSGVFLLESWTLIHHGGKNNDHLILHTRESNLRHNNN